MIAKTIKFTDYNDKEQTETFHFNISKGEAVMMEMAAVDAQVEGMTDKIERLQKSRDGKEIVEIFKQIIGISYGIKTADGRFLKEDEKGNPLVVHFRSTGAYSELAFELATDAVKGAEFINGLFPANVREGVKQEVANQVAARQPQDFQKKQVAEQPSVTVLPEPAAENLDELSREDLLARLKGN